jgi:CIC family chloride channel protein
MDPRTQINNTLTAGQRFLDKAFDLRGLARWLALGVVVGLVAGASAILFHVALDGLRTFSFNALIGLSPGRPGGEEAVFDVPVAGHVRYVLIVALPAAGAFLAGLLVRFFAPEAKGHGTDAAINSFHRKGGHIRKRVPVIKFFATVLTMGSGGSGGAEGPIAQIGAGFGSFIADRLKLGPREKRLLMISGVGAGVGAIFQVPLAGAIFAAEVLYSDPDIETDAIIPACVCSIVAYCVYGAWHGFGHMFPVSGMSFQNPLELLPYLLLALLVTAGALLYIWVFYGTEGAFNRLRLPFIVKPLIGGLMTGATALALLLIVGDEHVIDVMSTGYGILQDALSGQIVEIGVLILLAVAIGKIFTTSFSIASGGSAGVFGPSLVIGGTLGGAAGLVFQGWWPGLVQNPSSFAMVGMAGFFAAAANTPLSAVIMVSEMTTGRRHAHPRHQRHALRELVANLRDVAMLVRLAAPQYRVGGRDGCQRLVDDPAEGPDLGAREVALEPRGLVDRCGLGQGHEQDAGEVWVAQAGKQLAHALGHVARLAQHLAMIGLGRVEQQDGVPGRRGVEHDEAVLPLSHRSREGAEHRDLLGAG